MEPTLADILRLLGLVLTGAGLSIWTLPDVKPVGLRRAVLITLFIAGSFLACILPLAPSDLPDLSGKKLWMESVADLYALALLLALSLIYLRHIAGRPERPLQPQWLDQIREAAAQQERNRSAAPARPRPHQS